jgi:hypothetical protein
MQTTIDLSPQTRALRRIRALSRPIQILTGIALALAIVGPTFQILVMLFLPGHHGSWRPFLSFDGWGVGLGIGPTELYLHSPVSVPLDSLSTQQRWAVAGLGTLCAVCVALALNHLYRLFALYSRGIVFAEDNIARIKGFAMWLVAAAIAAHICGRLFVWLTGVNPQSTANTALAVILGAMIYVIGHVMALGREADLERKDFV